MEKRFLVCVILLATGLLGCQTDIVYPKKVIQTEEGPKLASEMPKPGSLKEYEHMFERHGVKMTRQGEKIRLVLPTDAFFEQGVDHQRYEQFATLYNIMRFYKQYGTGAIEVLGFTDTVGHHHELMEKSWFQSHSIAAFLWANGIEPNDVITKNFGPELKLDNRSSPMASASNRRVEIRFDQSPETAHL